MFDIEQTESVLRIAIAVREKCGLTVNDTKILTKQTEIDALLRHWTVRQWTSCLEKEEQRSQ